MTKNSRYLHVLKDMEWFGETPDMTLGRTRSSTRKVSMEDNRSSTTNSGPYYMNVERVDEEVINLILDNLQKEPVKPFLEKQNFSVVDCEKVDFSLYARTELSEPEENIKGPKELDPEQYKEVFTTPTRFQDAWNHPDPFQRKM